jgi:3-hydroxyacyl-CoA dehydrogenase/enoyl-CoA hydratase/3-hydroxybutyryl-CoA epimerase
MNTPSFHAFRLEDLSSRAGFKLWNLIFDLPGEKVNKMGSKVLQDFETMLPWLEEQGKTGALEALMLTSAKPKNFIAGADIEMIRSAKTASEAENLSRLGQGFLDRWEDLPFPTIVAIEGPAVGGGCEMSLASTAIVLSASKAVRIGLPEVQLGIIPGMGGCVRLPRKVGLATALDMILTGKLLSPERAQKAGLADAVLPEEDFFGNSIQWIRNNLDALKQGRRLAKEPKLGGTGGAIGVALEKTPMGRSIMLKKARSSVMEKSRGKYPAPLEAIEVLDATHGSYGSKILGSARKRAMEIEAKGFGRMAETDVSKQLMRLFFLTEVVKKSKGVESVTQSAAPISNGAVLGAGVMGGGIAQLLADKGVPVRMKDITTAALAAGATQAARIFKRQVQKRRLTPRQHLQKMNLIAPTLDFAGFTSTEFVIEAVIEKMEIKKQVLADLETRVSDTCVIASNTSSLSISEMQTAMKHPERFGGMHFFNPVSQMPLVEVIRGKQSSDQTVSVIYQFCKQLGKTPIVVKDTPGFLVNRLLMPFLNEATWLLGDGGDIEAVDALLKDFGMPMGAFELIDEVGIDVGDKVAHILHDGFGDRMKPSPFNQKLVDSGRLGKKNQKGFYNYEAGGKNKTFSSEIYSTLGVSSKGPGGLAESEIIDRCILPMVNEAARCLDEGVVSTPGEVDLGMIMGTGFPPFRGGLLRYADSRGLKDIASALDALERRFGARYKAAESLLERAKSGRTFYSES